MEANYDRELVRLAKKINTECNGVVKTMQKMSKLFTKLSKNFRSFSEKERESYDISSEDNDAKEEKQRRRNYRRKSEFLGIKRKREDAPKIQGRILKINCLDKGSVKAIGYKIQTMINNVKTELGPFLKLEKAKAHRARLNLLLKGCSNDKLANEESIRQTFNGFRDKIYEENPPAKTEKELKGEANANKVRKQNRISEDDSSQEKEGGEEEDDDEGDDNVNINEDN